MVNADQTLIHGNGIPQLTRGDARACIASAAHATMHGVSRNQYRTMAEARTATDAICARPEVRAALARGDWTVVLRAFLDDGLSQTAIAARAGLAQSQVSRLANGQSHAPGMNTG